MTDKVFYQVIADELKSKTMDTALWTQAYATAEGNPDKTEAVYIRLRFIDLKKSASAAMSLTAVDNKNAEIKNDRIDSELAQLRSRLAKKLLSQGKHSLYSSLGLHPDASDAAVGAAIADYESRNQDGAMSSEFRYAKTTLGNPILREQYDRKLLEGVSNEISRATYEYAGNDHAWWGSGKVSAIIAVLSVVLFGFLGLNYYKEHNNHELQKVSVDTQRDAVNSTTNTLQMSAQTDQMRAQADIELRNEALRIADERQRREMDLRVNATDRILEQQRLEQDRREQANQQRLKLQQEQAENIRINREKQYYACLNQQLLSQRDTTSADATGRCSMYR
jgi:hypothetical protein